MDSKNYTQVLIDGKIYTLGGVEEEAYLQKAASYVNEKNAQMRKLPGFTKQNADFQMVMTELNIADDYFKAVEWAQGMERQKNDMEKETYSLKHELVSTQMKLEAVLRDLEERQKELDRLTRAMDQVEGELQEVRGQYEALKNSRAVEAAHSQVRSGEMETISQVETVEEVESVEEEVLAAGAAEVSADSATSASATAPANTADTARTEAAATLQSSGVSDEELAKRALQAAKKANLHRGGRR